MNRPSRSETLLRVAMTVAERGTCDRKKVGAVIAREGRIITVGYNGAPPGLPHCDENNHGYAQEAHEFYVGNDIHGVTVEMQEKLVSSWIGEKGCRNATHAEANALAFAAKYGVSTDDAELFVTVSPCENCARLLIAAGIRQVHYLEEYRISSGVDLLAQAGILALYWKHES